MPIKKVAMPRLSLGLPTDGPACGGKLEIQGARVDSLGHLPRQLLAVGTRPRPLAKEHVGAHRVETAELLFIAGGRIAIFIGQINRGLSGGEEQTHLGAGQARHEALHRISVVPGGVRALLRFIAA